MRQRILKVLRESSQPISGELLSQRLGISRVAVWKHIQVLKRLGYAIESSASGYRLLRCPDLLLPEELGELGIEVYHFFEVSSTMDVARELAQKGETALVIAERQTKGQGRLGRHWHSEKGGIYFSLILRPDLPPSKAPLLSLMASIAVAKVIKTCLGLKAQVKWPNDVIINEKKVAGILVEMEAEVDSIKYVNLGIGINANNDISYFQNSATSLSQLLGQKVDRKTLLKEVVQQIRQIQSLTPEAIVNEWQKISATLGQRVRVMTLKQTIEGLAVGIDSQGALLLETPSGIKKILAGDCIHLRPSSGVNNK